MQIGRASANMIDTNQELNQALCELFTGHDIDCEVNVDHLAFKNKAGLKLWGEFTEAPAGNIRLNIHIEMPDGRTLVESFVGFASSQQPATANAFLYFCVADFHVLLNTFFGPCQHEDQVTIEEWVIAGVKRKVICGNVIPRQVGNSELTFDCFQNLQSVVEAAQLDDRMHWIRLFYGQKDNQPLAHELLLDNQPWEPHQSQVPQWKWAQQQDFYSMRMFLTILPIDN
ncbi:MAG: hypothetical protein IPP97_08135 [Candidatus Obscuribacter sp.]|jgi:hypothetical protein|nr:hypothetical protein [Candidatus Obscuribacter sp.]MBP6592717.1 hypothetical protein [Candidatus Obscuribacter sp.]MBP7575505.1 hypothetical protein [Candidatus Obscuribacter sp.]